MKNNLPDSRGPLSSSLPTQAIQANEEVKKVVESEASKKRGPYMKYSPKVRADIGRYAVSHIVAQTARYFLRKLGKSLL